MISGIGSSQYSIVQQMQNMFAKTDTDANGTLTLDEFKAGASHDAKSTNGLPSLEDLFTEADTDGNGELSASEFSTLMEKAPKGPPPAMMSDDMTKQLLEMFQNTDSDSNGSLTLDEFIAGAGDINASDITKLEDLFATADADEDGVLSEEEFTAAMSKPKGPPPGAGGPPPSGGSEDIASSEEESEEDLLLKMLEEATEAYKTNSLTQLLEAFSTSYNEDTNSLLNYSA